MKLCPHCKGTGIHLDPAALNAERVAADPGLKEFMDATDIRTEEEAMMQSLFPHLFTNEFFDPQYLESDRCDPGIDPEVPESLEAKQNHAAPSHEEFLPERGDDDLF